MASVWLTSSLLISTIFVSESVPDSGSLLKLSEQNPGFDGINTDLFHCDGDTKEGSFTFDSGRGVAHFAMNHDTVYVEYFAPTFWWTGISAAGLVISFAFCPSDFAANHKRK